jgi:hypothetical protein
MIHVAEFVESSVRRHFVEHLAHVQTRYSSICRVIRSPPFCWTFGTCADMIQLNLASHLLKTIKTISFIGPRRNFLQSENSCTRNCKTPWQVNGCQNCCFYMYLQKKNIFLYLTVIWCKMSGFENNSSSYVVYVSSKICFWLVWLLMP